MMRKRLSWFFSMIFDDFWKLWSKFSSESSDDRYDIFVKDRIGLVKDIIFKFKVTDNCDKLEVKVEAAVLSIDKNN